ncbi:hypothetical protein PYJP_01530 [Pyrofollis japonicus]|nr:hypothetical protein PYJP_01530 [Pyrofollis japonicus]
MYVVTETGHVGFAFAVPEAPLHVEVIEDEHSLGELMGLAWQHPLLTSVALAAANAAMQALVDDEEDVVCFSCDLLEMLGLRKGDRVAIIGYVHRVADMIADIVGRGNVVLYEDNPMHRLDAAEKGLAARPGNQFLIEAEDYDVVLATGASLVDPRLMAALERRMPRVFAMVGPTSSFHPGTARQLGLTVYGGSHVPRENRDRVLRRIKAGYGFKAISKLVRKWSVALENN